MSNENARGYVQFFEECQTRIQTLGELLLITCKPFPVFTHQEDLAVTNDNFVRFRDEVISHLNKLLIISRDVSSQVHVDVIHWKSLRLPLTDLTSTIVQLIQLLTHIAYILAINGTGSEAAVLGPVTSKHRIVQADLELKFVCARLKRSRISDLSPRILVDLCGNITKSLSAMTDICRGAAEKVTDSSEQDQFKLCIKAITSTAGCLVSSIKSFKHTSDDRHLQRLVCFCLPLMSTSAALLAFATEDQFFGSPAVLSVDGNEIYKSVIGLAMSMVSACVQITKALKDLVHDQTRIKHKDRVSLCIESISRAASRLRELLLSYEFSSPLDWLSRIKADEDFNHHKLSPLNNKRDTVSDFDRVSSDSDYGQFLSAASISALSSSTSDRKTSSKHSPKSKRSSSKSSSSKSKRNSSSLDNSVSLPLPKTSMTPTSQHAISEKESPSIPDLSSSSAPVLSPTLSTDIATLSLAESENSASINSGPPLNDESVLSVKAVEENSGDS